jgi:hypothetical protein
MVMEGRRRVRNLIVLELLIIIVAFLALGEEKVLKIKEEVDLYVGKEVMVEGRFLGWRGDIPHPQITFSDWVLEDNGSKIYVSGKWPGDLDPYKDVGRYLIVRGIVRKKEGVPYIEASSIKVIPIVSIGRILENLSMYKGEVIEMRGEFLGWTSKEAIPPRITRSDWAVRDKTGSIYITGLWPGGFDPVKDIGRIVIIRGRVRLKGEVPYIEAKEVIPSPEGKPRCKMEVSHIG